MKIETMIARQSGTRAKDWVLIDGPDSGCGVDYWFRNEKTRQEAYVNDDQGYISISITDPED